MCTGLIWPERGDLIGSESDFVNVLFLQGVKKQLSPMLSLLLGLPMLSQPPAPREP